MKHTGPDEKTVKIVEARALYACERCGRAVSRESCQVHHRRPRGLGGSSDPSANSPSNLILVCNECHAWIESNRTTSYEQGWLVHRYHSPERAPIWLAGRGFAFLSPDGTVEEIDEE